MNPRLIALCLIAMLMEIAGYTVQAQSITQKVATAVANNLGLHQQQLLLQQEQSKLAELKAKHLPSLQFQARYSRAIGGRTFDVPTGDLLNGVYQNLNFVNSQLDPTAKDLPIYPTIGNESIYFLRPKEQDTYFQAALPLFNPILQQSKRLQSTQVSLAEKQLDFSKNTLIYEVKKAYIQLLKIAQLEQVAEQALALTQENVKTAESLFKHHQVTQDYVYSAKVDVKSVEEELAQLQKQQQVATAYFNTLLNQPLSTPVPLSVEDIGLSAAPNSVEAGVQEAIQNRVEIDLMNLQQAMAAQALQSEKAAYLPALNLVGQYGIQGTTYTLNKQSDYALGSLVLSWTIFEGARKHKIEQAQLDQAVLEQQKKQLQQQIELELIAANQEVATAKKTKQLTVAQNESAKKAYHLVHKKFQQGQANLMEITHARTQLTQSEQAIIVAQYDYWLQLLALEKAMGK